MAYNKYRVSPKEQRTLNGVVFASKGEMMRYRFLLIMKQSGEIIGDISLQVPYVLTVNGHKICTYKADFVYHTKAGEVVEDYKGVVTPEFKLKAKLFNACFGYNIQTVKKPTEWALERVTDHSNHI